MCVIFATSRLLYCRSLPEPLVQCSCHTNADDIWDRRIPDAKASVHAKMGINERRGCVPTVRPDGHVGCVVDLVEGCRIVDALNNHLAAFVLRRN